MVSRHLADIEADLPKRGQREHLAVAEAARRIAWFDAVLKVADDKVAYEQKDAPGAIPAHQGRKASLLLDFELELRSVRDAPALGDVHRSNLIESESKGQNVPLRGRKSRRESGCCVRSRSTLERRRF
jgi:hypothetical protein